MRVGIFTDTYTPDINGVVSSIVALETGLRALGHEVFIITGQKNTMHFHREGNVLRLPGVELKFLYGYTLSTPYHIRAKKEVAALQLDVIHVQQEFSIAMFGRLMAHELNIPIVYTYHTLYEDYTHYVNPLDFGFVDKVTKNFVHFLSNKICNSVSAVIAPSKKTEEKLLGYQVKRPIYVIPTGIDLSEYKEGNMTSEEKLAMREYLQISPSTKVVTYLGRVAAEKSIDLIIDSIPHITYDDYKVMIVGGGPSLEDLQKQAKKLGVEDKVIFVGAVPKEYVYKYYLISDVFVSASTSETQGMTFIEALSCGLPVFARKDEVLEHLIIEGKTGEYFEDAKTLANKLDTFFMMDDETYSMMKQEARNIVSSYDIDTFARHISYVYEEAIKDYEECYIIRRIRSSSDCMKLFLESKKDKRELSLLISLEDYVLFGLKKDDYLERYVYDELKDHERYLNAYRMCIHRLEAKDRTIKEMSDFLKSQDKIELNENEINGLIETLIHKGYLNDEAYMVLQIDKMNSQLFGHKKMIRKLVEKGISIDDIGKVLELDEEEEYIKALKMANKYMMTIKNKSVQFKKNKIREKLFQDGYVSEVIDRVMMELNFEEDLLLETVHLQKTIEKAYRSNSKKYEGKELENRVIKYCLTKGYMYDDIKQVLEEMEGMYE